MSIVEQYQDNKYGKGDGVVSIPSVIMYLSVGGLLLFGYRVLTGIWVLMLATDNLIEAGNQ